MAWRRGFVSVPLIRSHSFLHGRLQPIGSDSISPQTPTVNPVDDEDMEEEQEGSRIPPAAREFLERHRPAQNDLGSTRRDVDHEDRHDDEGEDNNKAGDQRGDDGELGVDCPGVDGGLNVAEDAEPGFPAQAVKSATVPTEGAPFLLNAFENCFQP